MRKLAEKIAIIAQTCIALIFALTTVLYMSNVIPRVENATNNGIFTAVLAVLGIAYLALSGYIVYVNFSSSESLKKIMLYCNSESATQTNAKVINNIIKSCEARVGGIKVKRAKIKTDENNGLVLTLKVSVTADSVSQPLDHLHCLLADSFANVLGLTFNSINFEVTKLQSSYSPNVSKAAAQAEEMADQRDIATEIYNEPLPNHDDSAPKRKRRKAESNSSQEESDNQTS